ncbi:MAG: hypothetical protein DYG89_29770 [Caldilinea sp. CFX5]|nr:hypothetical protein [Caldilinea sp. CFX5]
MRYDSSIIPQRLNPMLTPALEQEVAFFLKWGYLVIEDALTSAQVESLRTALDETFARKQSQFTHQLLEEDDRFAFLLDHPPVLSRMKALLGNCVQLHSATARVTTPGAPDQDWHRDGPWPVDPDGTPFGSIPGQINCGYYLDELTMQNGPIAVVPGSQRAPFKPPKGHPEFPDQVYLLAKPGQAVMFNGWLYHRGVANHSTQNRRVCLMCYQNAWMKSREPFDGPRVTKLREAGNAERKMLLGGVPNW